MNVNTAKKTAMLSGASGSGQPLVPSAAEFSVSHTFSILLGALHVVVLVAFAVGTKPVDSAPGAEGIQLYNFLVGVTLMMLVGFGYLMTFLRWYGLGAVGLTMLITCLGLEVSLLVEPLFTSASWGSKIEIGLMSLLNADFAVAAFLISFGGLIGKVGPAQLVLLVVFESICCALPNALPPPSPQHFLKPFALATCSAQTAPTSS